MRKFWDVRQRLHSPIEELHNGAFVPYAETPARAERILTELGAAEAPTDHGEAPILAVHAPDYVAFLKAAFAEWREAGRPGDAAGYVWPAVRRRDVPLRRIDARLGRYSYDVSTPIAAHSFESAYWSAQSALTAMDALLSGERAAFALCRPPGHHAGADYLGGYCYLNNAALAAEAANLAGRRTAILDVDYHHGNGTQDIFYSRGDVFFASIHADPATDYPFFWGHADEVGEGEGAAATLNLPLDRGASWAEYEPALDRALEAVAGWGADLLVLSFGADTWEGDPISFFRLRTGDYETMARRIAALGLPTLIVMEGGYGLDALGANVATFLRGYERW